MELELHASLDLVRSGVGVATGMEVVEQFRQVANAWIFKLHSVYGLPLLSQPERVLRATCGTWPHLSLLRWDAAEVADLLRCPFYRPEEQDLLRLVEGWWLERGGAAGHGADEAVWDVLAGLLLSELLPSQDADGPGSADRLGAATAAADPSATDDDGGAEPSPLPPAGATVRVPAASFERIPRRKDCPTLAFDSPDAFRCQLQGDDGTAGPLRCRNAASEDQVLGASRQAIASRLPMPSGRGGRYRLDLRVMAGTESEAAAYLEVGLVAEPAAGVWFLAGQVGAGRPASLGEGGAGAGGDPFLRLVPALDTIVEGVRLVVEVDFDEALVHIRNLPPVDGVPPPPPTPIAAWLAARAHSVVLRTRDPGELDCNLFREEALHLQDLINRGTLDGDLADSVLGDTGAQLQAAHRDWTPVVSENYHFYVVVPAGMEVDIL